MRRWQREMLQEEAERNARLPQGVLDAEAILAEQRRAEMAVVAESLEGTCMHDDLSVYRVIKDLSDVETDYGCCLRCGQWLVRTAFLSSDRVEDRPMTDTERTRLQAYEDSLRSWRD